MTGRVVFFSNPQSHGVQKNGSQLHPIYKTRNHSRDIYMRVEAAQDTAADFKALQFTPDDHLFIEGGDGTMQRSLTALLNSLDNIHDCPKISIIAGGLTNQIAANIGLKTGPRRDRISAAIAAPQNGLRPTPILKLTCANSAPQFGCLFSSGALPFVTEYYDAKIRANQAGGKMAIAGTLLKVMAGSQTARDKLMPATDLSLTLHVSGQTRTKTGPHLGTVVTTLPSLMMGLDPFWNDAQPGDIRLLYASAKARRLLRNLSGLWLGRKTKDRSGDGLESYRADHAAFHYHGPLALDGEPIAFGGAPFSVSATPPLPFVTAGRP